MTKNILKSYIPDVAQGLNRSNACKKWKFKEKPGSLRGTVP